MTSSHFNTSFTLSDVEIGVLTFVNVVFSIGGSIGNIMVCFTFLTHHNLRSIMNIFILSLACSDLIVCLVSQPMFVVSILKNYQQDFANNLFEDIRKRLTWISLLASAGNLLGVTLDRYVAISEPLKYPARVTRNRAYFFVSLVWTVAICLGSTTVSYAKMKMVGQMYVLFLLVVLVFPLYFHVLLIARKHARVIQSAMSHMVKFGGNNLFQQQRASISSVRKADRNSLRTVGIISCIFVVGWFPILITPIFSWNSSGDPDVVFRVFQWVNTLALCSSACNPLVYSWRDRRFRKALLGTYERWTSKRIVFTQNRVGVEMTRIPESRSELRLTVGT